MPALFKQPAEARAQAVRDYARGVSSSVLARRYGVYPMTVLRWVRQAGQPVRDKHDANRLVLGHSARTRAEAVEGYRAGMNTYALAQRLHVHRSTIARWAREAGVPVRPVGRGKGCSPHS